MRRPGAVVAEMLEACAAAASPGITTADLDKVARDGARQAQGQVQLPRLPRVPGGDLHLAQRRRSSTASRAPYRLVEGDIISIDCGAIIEGWHADAARDHPRRRGRRGGPQLLDGHRGQLCGRASTQVRGGHRLVRYRPRGARRSPSGPGSPSCASTSATASARAMHEEPADPQLRRPGQGHEAQGRPRASPSSRWSTWAAPRPSCNDDGWTVITADGAARPTSSTRSPSPSTAPRC